MSNKPETIVKDLVEQPTIALEELTAETDTNVAESVEVAESALQETVASLEVLYDAWNRPIPTELFVIESINYPDLIQKIIQAGNFGAKLNPTKRILINAWPYRVHLMLPSDIYQLYQSIDNLPVFDESVKYNKITVRAFNNQKFFETFLNIASQGAVWEPNTPIVKSPKFSVRLLTRAPIAANQNVLVGVDKVSYTKEELESFDIKQLTIIGSWYNLSFKSKDKFIKGILQSQPE